MPMSIDFENRLFPNIPAIIKHFDSPCFIYDEAGIRSTGKKLKQAFAGVKGFKEFFAVKALPNPEIMKIMRSMGFGFDCSSIMELQLAEHVGASGSDIMFTSNDTSVGEFYEALMRRAILNLDDISMVDTLSHMALSPPLICFRYNPGNARSGNAIIGQPAKAKYGITNKQLIPAYKMAREAGASIFGIHTMVCSNQRNWRYMVATVRMLLRCCEQLEKSLGIKCKFMNMGGGLGINYKPNQKPLQLVKMAFEIKKLLADFKMAHGWVSSLYMESGRYMTGPHGVLVTQVINRKDTYQMHIGVNACPMASIPRPMIYDAYHHVTVLDSLGRQKKGKRELVNVVGPACENTDRFATDRFLPKTARGDIIVVHDAGAHSLAMAFNYNGRTRPQELLLRVNGTVERIRRAETEKDLWQTICHVNKAILTL
jgi:diaminopimelate decarboxylase